MYEVVLISLIVLIMVGVGILTNRPLFEKGGQLNKIKKRNQL